MQILQKYILNTLVFDEDQKSLSQTVTWLNLAGHHAEPCKDYTEFVDKLTNEEMYFDVVIFDFNDTNAGEFDSLHGVRLFHFYNGQKKQKPKFILYTNQKQLAAQKLEDIKNAQVSTIIYKSLESMYFFEKIANQLELPASVGEEWEKSLNYKINKPTNNVIQLKPK